MKTLVCDRCGIRFEEYIGIPTRQILEITRERASTSSRTLDLCYACTAGLDRWLYGAESVSDTIIAREREELLRLKSAVDRAIENMPPIKLGDHAKALESINAYREAD